MAHLAGVAFAPEANPQVTGRFNPRYGVAAVLARGGFGLADIEPETALDPAIRPLVDASPWGDENRTSTFAPADVTIETRDGRRLHHRVETRPGSSEAPLSEDEIHAKLVAAFSCRRNALPPARIEALVQRIHRLEGVDDVSTLFDQVL